MRGQFMRGWSDMGSLDAGRVLGSAQAGTYVSKNIFQAANISILNGDDYVAGGAVSGAGQAGYTRSWQYYRTRPTNVALAILIKY
jgi:hypothetical protein